MSETRQDDPWAKVRTFDVSTYGDCRMEQDYYGEIASEQKYQRGEYAWVDEVDAARAAEAAQHQQEMSQQAAHIANLEHMVREHGQFGDLFQPGGRFHKDAQLEPGSVAVVAGGKWLVARLAAVEAERDRMKAALEFYANPFGRLDSNGERVTVPDFYAEMEFGGIARAALTPQGQSTDGETR